MESEPNMRTDSLVTEAQREHLEGIERERIGLPYSREEFDRELHIVQEQKRLEEESLRVYADYTFTILEFTHEFDLAKNHDWNRILQHIADQNGCANIVWGRDLCCRGLVLALIEWSHNPPQDYGDVSRWQPLELLLHSQPRAMHIALNPPGLFEKARGRYLDEITIISGSDDILNPPDPLKLFNLPSFAESTIPLIGHEPSVEFSGYAQGITPSMNGTRTIAIRWSWVGEVERSRFIDPTQSSYGCRGDDEYDQQIGSRLQSLEDRGAVVSSYLCQLQSWSPPAVHDADHIKSKRCCTVM